MKRYRFITESVLPDRLICNPVVLEIARNMEPEDIVTALVDLGIQPETAATTAGALMRHAFDAMAMATDTETDTRKLGQRKHASQIGTPMNTMFGEGVMSPGDDDFPDFLFPDEEEEPDEWPYDDATVGVMNSPLAGYPRTN